MVCIHFRRIIVTICFASFIIFSAVHQASANGVSSALQSELSHCAPELCESDWYSNTVDLEDQWLFKVYQNLAFQPLWVTKDEVKTEGLVLLKNLLTADLHGLVPADYNTEKIESLMNSVEPEQLARLDIALTKGFLKYTYDLSEGRRVARQAFPELFAEAGVDLFDPNLSISQLKLSDDLHDYLLSLGPRHRYYELLRDALADHRRIKMLGGWPEIAAGTTIHPDDTDPRVSAIKKLLQMVGDLDGTNSDDQLFDPATVEAVKQYQFRHGLVADGIVGRQTRAVMNVPVEWRIEQLALNLERWRWNYQELGRKYVLVNLAGFTLKAIQDEQTKLEMPVIVGQLANESPVFSDKISYAEFNPFWNLPPQIAQKETLVQLREDPNYLAANHIRLFSSWGSDALELDPLAIDWNEISLKQIGRYKLRQDPGPWNALGTMKFVFPNRYSVYLHDTPHRDLFSEPRRAFSHGCIRLSDPSGLAVFLMGGQDNNWNLARVEELVKSDKRKVVVLPEKVPVHLTYLTAWHDKDGQLRFSDDLYNRDKMLVKALKSIN
jgi:murein L,D-transpeptidase YcbB/YkuD